MLLLTGSRFLLDVLSPKTALELGDGGSLAAALLWVPLGVTLDEDVETSAGCSLVAKSGASAGVIRGKELVGEISAALNRAVKVGEGLSVTTGGFGIAGQAREDRVALKGINSIRQS
jgi:hypothetical protein